jgi:2'-5' RNA ligase
VAADSTSGPTRPAPLLAAVRSAVRRLLGRPGEAELACALLPGAELTAAVRALQEELRAAHGHLGPEAPPHVTLKLGFAGTDVAAHARHLAALAARSAPVALEVEGFGAFDEGILYLDVVKSPALEQLRRRLLADLAARFGVRPHPLEVGDRFHFHLTLAHGLPPEAFAAARRQLLGRGFRARATAERLALLRFAGDRWAVEGTWALEGGAPTPSPAA